MKTIRLASWNIRKCVGLDWRRNPHRIVHGISQLDADIVALQEVDKRLGMRPAALPPQMVREEANMEPVDIDPETDSLGWHGNAVLLGEGLEAERVRAINLPGLEPRGALIVDVAGNGRKLRVVAVHLGLVASYRTRQCVAILKELSAMKSRPTIIMGDFNNWSAHRHMAGLDGFEVHIPGLSFHAARPVAALDLFALSPDVEMRRMSVERSALTRIASDHLPVTADIRVD